jgi:hypothetical protein
MTPAGEPAWDDPSWKVKADTPWQAGLRWQQCWWRSERLGLPAGPFSIKHPSRLVGSTLAFDAPKDANFLTAEAADAATRRLAAGGGGLVSEDRLRRFLLSSQPMCFNLFGHFQGEHLRGALLPWVHRISPVATAITLVEVEWAPPADEHFGGGSAFDAFVEYELDDGGLGFLGVECKYHEHLPKTDVPRVRETYKTFTTGSGLWRDDAVEQLDRPGRRQFWLNTLLVQSLLRTGRYREGRCLVMACAADRFARTACDAVRAQLHDPQTLRWEPWEAIVASIGDHDAWRALFVSRYLDFAPVAHLLDPDDPRAGRAVSVATAYAVAERVLGDGSVLEQLEQSGGAAPLIWSRLAAVVDELKRLRVDAGRALDAVDAPEANPSSTHDRASEDIDA